MKSARPISDRFNPFSAFVMALALSVGNLPAHAEPPSTAIDVGRAGAFALPAAGKSLDASSINASGLAGLSDDGFVTGRTGEVLDAVSRQRSTVTRGAKEAKIYQQYARSVVLILTEDGLGSGVLVDRNGLIVTNWHVIGNNKQVGVIFKPKVEGQAPQKADVRRAEVVRVDQVADLALIKVREVPVGVEPIPLGEVSEISVGSDVHAIGHPTGEAWTYTKGFVSQIRNDYQWSGGKQQVAHKANVIQTQTPINAGNSGGPLISSEGRVIGINSFKSSGEGLNFAVAANEVSRFLNSNANRLAKQASATQTKSTANSCKPKVLEKFNSSDDSSQVSVIDLYCKGTPSAVLITPYDIRKPIMLDVAEPDSDKTAGRIFDRDRDGKWDFSVWDSKRTGKWDVLCMHPDGSASPDRCEPYKDKG